MSAPESTTGNVHSAFIPCPGHYTRENWLAYRVIAQLSESGLDINTSPAVQVWDVAHREIIAWMKEHGIETGLRPNESTPNNIPADVREAIEKAWEDAFDAYCKECGDSSAHQAACISIRSALAPFFAARDEEIARLKDRLLASQQEVEIAQQMRESDSYHLKRQLDEAQRRLGEAYGQFSGAEETIAKLSVDLNRHHGMALHNIARAEAAEKQLAEAKKDSARLHWLSENPQSIPYLEDGLWKIPYLMDGAGGFGGGVGEVSGRTLAAVIDAAMQQEVKQ